MFTIIFKNRSEKGSVTIIALMILVVLTLLGVTITRTTSIDVQIAGNEIPYKQNFYAAEGGVNREAAEVGRGEYPVINIGDTDAQLANQDGQANGDNLPGDETDHIHRIAGKPYDFNLVYKGYFLPPAGYSVIHFSRYDYRIDAFAGPTGSKVHVGSRYFKIGPKAEE